MTTRNAATMLGSRETWATWECRGYAGRGNVAPLVDSYVNRPALVCGSDSRIFLDFESALKYYHDPVIFAVNDIGMYLPRVDHWLSLHSKNLQAWKAVRWLHPSPMERTIYHSIELEGVVDYTWENLTPLFALSGYFAMQVAYIMGCSPIVLAGCPGTHTRRFFEAAPRTDLGYGSGPSDSDANIRNQVVQEMNRLPDFKKSVRSMSGWTKEFFGDARR